MTDERAGLDYFKLLSQAKKIDAAACARRVRVALLADCSTQHLVPLLKSLFFRSGVFAEIYEADYDTVRQEIHNGGSGLYTFKPDVIVRLDSVSALRESYYSYPGEHPAFVEQKLAAITESWETIKTHCAATVFQSTFVLPHERIFGNFERKAGISFYNAVVSLNHRLVEAAGAHNNVLLNDLDYVASYLGRRRWFDEKMWILCKSLCALECLPYAAQNIVDMAKPLLGMSAKCLVLDLDNTLWGGVIGDDGLEGIRLGHLGDGEAFSDFQHYLLRLKRRGLILAVCSRNDLDNAVLPFRKHPDMVLKEDDIAVFVANWTNKADNIKTIQEALNIGLDSMVFLDDDPFERNLVRKNLPGVVVPEMPEDPADYVKTLSELNLFETASFSGEDARRADMYKEQSQRSLRRAAFTSTDDYLRSLKMSVAFKRFDAFQLPRIAQLLARSNQFNLTTKRYSETDCERFMKDTLGYFPFYITLKDDLGDSGLISAIILMPRAKTLEIDTWLMSCRVLLRGIEEHSMNTVVAFAAKNGYEAIVGRYHPTPKNAMVKDFFGRFGFQKSSEEPDGTTTWTLKPSEYSPRPVFFAEATTDN